MNGIPCEAAGGVAACDGVTAHLPDKAFNPPAFSLFGNKRRAARALGVSRSTLDRKLFA